MAIRIISRVSSTTTATFLQSPETINLSHEKTDARTRQMAFLQLSSNQRDAKESRGRFVVHPSSSFFPFSSSILQIWKCRPLLREFRDFVRLWRGKKKKKKTVPLMVHPV